MDGVRGGEALTHKAVRQIGNMFAVFIDHEAARVIRVWFVYGDFIIISVYIVSLLPKCFYLLASSDVCKK